MSLTKKAAAGIAIGAMTLVSSAVWAAAFQLTEQSVVTLGRAYSGSGVGDGDVSAAFYNPAALTLLPGTQIQAGVIGVSMNQVVKIYKTGVENDGQNKTEFIPNFYISHQINPEWWVGFSLASPFGLSTSYGKYPNWQYGHRGTEAELLDLDFNPSIAWKPNERFSIGGGISLQYAKAKLGLDVNVPSLGNLGHGEENGDSWAWGWNIGFLFKPTDKTQIGISYRSAIKHKASGDFSYSGYRISNLSALLSEPPNILGAISPLVDKYDSKVDIKTPDTVYASGLWEATEKLTIFGTIRWAKWSNCYEWALRQQNGAVLVPQLSLTSSAVSLSELHINHHYKDTWLFALGADYKLTPDWTVRGGVAYEKNAVDDQSYRVATIPDGDRLFLSMGASYNINKNWSVDTALLWVQGLGTSEFYDNDRKTAAALGTTPNKVGEWTTQHSLIYGLQMRYKF